MKPRNSKPVLDGTAFWIILSVWASVSGWILSALHQLHGPGYAVLFLVLAGGLFFAGAKHVYQIQRPRIRMTRFRRIVPAMWLGLAVLILAGGLLYAPNNYDYLTYRFPRILHWAWEQKWHWIETGNDRMNYSGTGFEWLMVPLFIFFKTDRLFFLINFISYLLLPGLVFSVFRALGIRRRLCWFSMWVLPSAYCFVMQAGSAGNDSFAAVYLLASLFFAFRARQGGGALDVALSLLSAALMTGAKASNLPLLLPCFIAVFPSLKVLFYRPVLLVSVLVFGLFSSFVPTALLNQHYAGHWSGDPSNSSLMRLSNPLAALVGNSLQVGIGAVAPPVFPFVSLWKKGVDTVLPDSTKEWLKEGFPRLSLGMGELPVEEAAGLGLGFSLFTLALLMASLGGLSARKLKVRGCLSGIKHSILANSPKGWSYLIAVGGVIAALVYMTKMGSESGARIMGTYYPLLWAALLLLLAPRLTTCRIWTWLGVLCLFSAVPVLLLTPARPLLPVRQIVEVFKKRGIQNATLDRAGKVYDVYANRSDNLAGIRVHLPPEAETVGFLQSGDDSEVGLWKPWGKRKVVSWTFEPRPDWVVASTSALRHKLKLSAEEWAQQDGYEVVSSVDVTSKVQEGSVKWVVLKKKQ